MTTESSAESTTDVHAAAHIHVAAHVHAAAADDVQLAADALVAAFAEGRLDDYFAAFAPDATFLFHSTQQRLTSVADYRALWQSWVDQDGFRVLSCRSSRPLIQIFGATAVFSHEVETRISTHGGQETAKERETIVFQLTPGQRSPDRWLAVHEHLSPAAPPSADRPA
ncbi:ketosteroid isomerase-like protein [Streptacidiphilus sp. MAP12-16]|uniref:YybH family protein n=1 Tax=Streptacidiphilus sp. MAP12-16 TaxID=3156300 RepID=UPI0035181454